MDCNSCVMVSRNFTLEGWYFTFQLKFNSFWGGSQSVQCTGTPKSGELKGDHCIVVFMAASCCCICPWSLGPFCLTLWSFSLQRPACCSVLWGELIIPIMVDDTNIRLSGMEGLKTTRRTTAWMSCGNPREIFPFLQQSGVKAVQAASLTNNTLQAFLTHLQSNN